MLLVATRRAGPAIDSLGCWSRPLPSPPSGGSTINRPALFWTTRNFVRMHIISVFSSQVLFLTCHLRGSAIAIFGLLYGSSRSFRHDRLSSLFLSDRAPC